ncbi:MAG: Mannose-6-phosphate isomerase [Candidatus Lokiarchaeum sp. GC14_75]|nr:MAG: Mannose-6-phosphate isomerase [Candidatus Lokiarchaeum sp. GC14_75]
MINETISSGRSTVLRKNDSHELIITLNTNKLEDIFIINGNSFKTKDISRKDLIIKQNEYYMIINRGNMPIEIHYDQNISHHFILYNPYKYEKSEKINFTSEMFIKRFEISKNYIDTLPKWYSFKFTYNDYNLIFVRPEFGLSIQSHKHRSEFWEILGGTPIIITGSKVHYFVKKGIKFKNPKNTYHSIINVNVELNDFVFMKEEWQGKFDENDIHRVFNPNKYY